MNDADSKWSQESDQKMRQKYQIKINRNLIRRQKCQIKKQFKIRAGDIRIKLEKNGSKLSLASNVQNWKY